MTSSLRFRARTFQRSDVVERKTHRERMATIGRASHGRQGVSRDFWPMKWRLQSGLNRIHQWVLAFVIVVIGSTTLVEGAQLRLPPVPTADQVVILYRGNSEFVFRDAGLPLDRGNDGRNLWVLLPAAPIVVGIHIVIPGARSELAGMPLPLAGGTTYRLVVVAQPFKTHYIWFENAGSGARVSYRFAILLPRR